jgi:hypothetical protein
VIKFVWLPTGRCFSLGTPVSSANIADHQNITEILVKMALNAINQTKQGYSSVPGKGYSSVPSKGYSSVSDKGYSRSVSCALNYISTCFVVPWFFSLNLFRNNLYQVRWNNRHQVRWNNLHQVRWNNLHQVRWNNLYQVRWACRAH